MNKKIFTLLAWTLVLFVTAFGSYAQPWKGHHVTSLSGKARENAYHLKVVALGDNSLSNHEQNYDPSTGLFLAMDSLGRLVLRDGDHIFTPSKQLSILERLNETLWCIGSESFTASHGAEFTFLNKHYGTDLSVNPSIGTRVLPRLGTEYYRNTANYWKSAAEALVTDPTKIGSGDSIRIYEYPDDHRGVWLGGNVASWLAGSTFVESVADSFALRIPVPGRRGWYLTLAVDDPTLPEQGTAPYNKPKAEEYPLRLVEVHGDDFTPGTPFYKNHLVLFALYETVPRLLTADDINKGLFLGGPGITLKTETYPLAAGEKDLFSTVTSAVSVGTYYTTTGGTDSEGKATETKPADNTTGSIKTTGDPYYVRLKTSTDNYIYVKDGTAKENYYTGIGRIYPKIDETASPDNDGRADFRLVYYPSTGTVVINVRQLRIAEVDRGEYKPGTLYSDTTTRKIAETSTQYNGPFWDAIYGNPTVWSDYYDYTDHTHLFVQAQLIAADSHVITAGGSTGDVAKLSSQFEIGAGAKGCAVIDDRTSVSDDLYLITDDQGRYLTVPLYTGTFSPQWEAGVSLTEASKSPAFHWFVQKYDGSAKSKVKLTNREFPIITFEYVQVHITPSEFSSTWIHSGTPQHGYGSNIQKALVGEKDFVRIAGREYRQNPHLGYRNIKDDGASLAAGNYTLEYYNKNTTSNPFYIGLTPAPTTDTLFRAVQSSQKTVFKLESRDANDKAPEPIYGITDSLYALSGLGYTDGNPDSIVQLRRTAYYLKISDYLSSVRNDRVVTLSTSANYVHTTESNASQSSGRKAEFYLRYQFQEGDKDYYTLLQRLGASDKNWLAENTNLTIAGDLVSTGDSFGMLQVSVHPYALTINAVSRFGTNETPSAFAFVTLDDPLYRRFNDEGLGNANPEEAQEDTPRYLRFFRARDAQDGRKDYLYEDQYSQYSYDANGDGTTAAGLGIRFLGMINEVDDRLEIGKDPSHPHNFTFYVDTAFVNRVGFTLKPQYLIAVDPRTDQLAFPNECPSCAVEKIDPFTYTYGRYLINAFDTAAKAASTYKGTDERKAAAYRYGLYDRLIFVKAVHIGDSLYILNDQILHATNGIPDDPLEAFKETLPAQGYVTASGDSYPGGTPYLNFTKLKANSKVVNLNNGGNHSDAVFSFRYAEQTGDAARPFFIESETTNRVASNGNYGLTRGGWVKYLNGYVVISRRDGTSESITDAELFDVESSDQEATSIKEISTPAGPKVIAGTGVVTILNASGKSVVLSNVLGQTVAKTVLTSDRADISAPSGVVIVSVEGLGSVKAIVK